MYIDLPKPKEIDVQRLQLVENRLCLHTENQDANLFPLEGLDSFIQQIHDILLDEQVSSLFVSNQGVETNESVRFELQISKEAINLVVGVNSDKKEYLYQIREQVLFFKNGPSTNDILRDFLFRLDKIVQLIMADQVRVYAKG